MKSKTDVLGMQRKAFSQVITRSQARKDQNDALVGGKLTEAQLKSLGECLIFTNFSSFSKLLYAVAAVKVLSNAWRKKLKPLNLNSKCITFHSK